MYRDLELYIGGEWVGAQSGQTKAVYDPATEDTLGTIADAGPEDLDRALAAAESGLKTWRAVGTWDRAAKIRKIGDLLRERVDDIANIMSLETGKPLAESRAEIGASADLFDWYSEETKRIYGYSIEGRTADQRISVLFQPVGVVAAFSAWNFPALLPARKIAAALGAGCSIIVKPAGESPASCAALVEACNDAGLPEGTVNYVTGQSAMIAKHLIGSPIVRKVSVTGSVPVGKEILHLAAEGVKKVSMELGGHGPVIVFDDADPIAAAEACATAKFRNCGQVCISPTRFYIHENSYEPFAQRFVEITSNIKLGKGTEPDTDMGPMANERGVEQMKGLVADAVENHGAELLAGGKSPSGFNRGYYFEPTVLGRVPDTARVMVEEPFGPIAPLTTFSAYEEVMERTNSLPFGLAGYVFTRDIGLAARASEDMETGMVGVNEMLLAAAEVPFGGIKESGMGREGGMLGIQDYLEPKLVRMKI